MIFVKQNTPYDGVTTYTAKERNAYLLGIIGQNMIYQIIGAGLQYYFESVIFLPALAVGAIMAGARVWDAFNDPMMGTLVDRTRTKWGKCRPWLLYCPLPLFFITVLCFTNFGFYTGANANHALIIAWAAVTYVLWGMCYTVGDIPLWGITAVMTRNDEHRNKLLSLARALAGLGGTVTLILIQPVSIAVGNALKGSAFAGLADDLAFKQGQRYGFLLVAAGFALIGCALFQLAGVFTRERIKGSDKKNSIVENFKLMWSNRPFRQILISGVLSSPKQVVMIVAMTLVNFYYANNDPARIFKYYAILGIGLFAGQTLMMILVPGVVKKIEKKTFYNWSNFLSAIPFAMIFVCYLLADGPNGTHNVDTPLFLSIYALMFTLAGASLGAGTVLQSLMIADCIDYEEYRSGLRPDGVFFSGQSFITKLSTGIAALMSSLGYFFVHFEKENREAMLAYMNSGGVARENPQFEPFMMIMFFLVSIPPAVGCILSALPTLHYALPDSEHKRMLAELNEKRQAESEAE